MEGLTREVLIRVVLEPISAPETNIGLEGRIPNVRNITRYNYINICR